MSNADLNPTCNADDEGRPCPREAVMLRPIALCHAHRIEVALTVVPELLRDQLDAALRGAATAPATRSELVATACPATAGDLLRGVHDSVVYFIANGGRVKIGYTTNLKSRLGSLALRRDAVLLTLQGGPELERALHTHFAAYRNGNTEWFELSPEIFRYIAAPHPSAEDIATPGADISTRGFGAHAATQSAQKALGVAKTAELFRKNSGLTSAQVAEELSVSPATAKRYLREARQVRP